MYDQVPYPPPSPRWFLIYCGLSSTWILLGQFSQNPLPLMFSLKSCPSTDPHLILDYKFPLVHALFRVEPNLSPSLQNPIAVVPTTVYMVLDKVCLSKLTSIIEFLFFNKSCYHWAQDCPLYPGIVLRLGCDLGTDITQSSPRNSGAPASSLRNHTCFFTSGGGLDELGCRLLTKAVTIY